MRRELALMLGSSVTWWLAAITAFVVGHSFVLATDLFSAVSRSVDAGMMTRGLEPLLGIVRPTLGGAGFCLTVLGPVLAVRSLAIERERRTLHSLLLSEGSVERVLFTKLAATGLGLSLVVCLPAVIWMIGWWSLGGHLALSETTVAFLGVVLHLGVMATWGIAAAAWTQSSASAIGVAMVLSLGSWVLDGASELAALGWLASISRWSLSPHLEGLQRGFVLWADVGWLIGLCIISLLIAWVGLQPARSTRWRAVTVGVVVLLGLSALGWVERIKGGIDCSEARRGSLPEATAAALSGIDEPIAIEVWLDRDDGRRAHLERDALLRLRLAIPGLRIRFPLDRGAEAALAIRDDDYGLLVVRVGTKALSTRSTARRELSTLMLEAAGRPVPPWQDAHYPGFPRVTTPTERRTIMMVAYVVLPLLFAWVGWYWHTVFGGTPT